MGTVIGEILPLAIGEALSPLPIIAVILMLFSKNARSTSLGFLLGWIAGLAVVGILVVLIANPAEQATGGESSPLTAVVRLVLGLLFLYLAYRNWQKRPQPGEQAEMPKWMGQIDTMTAGTALGLGALLSGVNPKNLALTLAADVSISQAQLDATQTVVALVVFILLASVSVAAPVILNLALGEKASATLNAWKAWLTQNNATVMTVLFIVFGVLLLLSACAGPAAPTAPATTEPAQLPNPASQNCIDVGGTLAIQERGDGGQYGVCYFEDNRQCEEWALMRGECPVGGLKITGYITDAAQYCVITGGTYTITGNNGLDDEQGTCTFPSGAVCDVWDYWNGVCVPNVEPTPAAGLTIQPLPMEVCDGQAQAMSHFLGDLIPTQSEEPLDDFVNNAPGTGCQATITGTGAQFESPAAVVGELGGMLAEQGWTADPQLVADGPTGTSAGYRKGDQICWAGAQWQPDESANCPPDQPVSACQVTPEQQLYTVTLNCGEEVSAGQAGTGVGAEQLVFDSTRGGSGYRDLFLMNGDGSGVTRLTEGDSNSFAGPWSPDGLRIAYTAYGPTNSYIAAINADGSGSTVIDQVEGSDEGFPAWSPDGTRIAFTSRRDGNNEIYVMNADGSNQVRLTNDPADDFAPSWSPDGTQIAFVSDRDQAQGVSDVYVMNVDGSEVTRLTNDEAIDFTPVWLPDDALIAFRSDEGGQADIYVINADGSGRRNLTNTPSNEWSPAWSPDGTRFAFQTDRDGNWEIYVMGLDGSGLVNLTNDPADDQLPFWRP